MVVVVHRNATPEVRAEIARTLARAGAGNTLQTIRGPLEDVICADGVVLTPRLEAQVRELRGVVRVVAESAPYPLASRVVHPEKTIVRVGDAQIGTSDPVIIAGPCSVEGEAQILEAAQAARDAGAQLLRGGAFKPRTSPYSFQGLGLAGLDLLARAGRAVGLPVVTEVMEPGLVKQMAELADVLQIGSRNMQNYPLLRAAGRAGRPVLLKRGFAATVEEWLLAAEYVLAEGNPNVILCERGIRSFDPQTRNVLDLTCVPLLARLTHLPVIVDPSHGTGRRDLVLPMGIAALAAGADGLIVEMHPRPEDAVSDKAQTIDPAALRQLVRRGRAIRVALAAADAYFFLDLDSGTQSPEELVGTI